MTNSHLDISFTVDDAGIAAEVVSDLTRMNVDFGNLEVTSPSLDDVFAHLTLTGARS